VFQTSRRRLHSGHPESDTAAHGRKSHGRVCWQKDMYGGGSPVAAIARSASPRVPGGHGAAGPHQRGCGRLFQQGRPGVSLVHPHQSIDAATWPQEHGRAGRNMSGRGGGVSQSRAIPRAARGPGSSSPRPAGRWTPTAPMRSFALEDGDAAEGKERVKNGSNSHARRRLINLLGPVAGRVRVARVGRRRLCAAHSNRVYRRGTVIVAAATIRRGCLQNTEPGLGASETTKSTMARA